MSKEYQRRLARLEQSSGDGLIIFFEEAGAAEGELPVIARAYVGTHMICRNEGETNDAFVARANPHRRPLVMLAADSEGL